MNTIQNLCSHFTRALQTVVVGNSTRDNFGFLGFLIRQTNRDITIASNSLRNGKTYILEYETADCTVGSLGNESICTNGAAYTPPSRVKSRVQGTPTVEYSEVITFNPQYFDQVCRGFDDANQDDAMRYRDAVAEMARGVNRLAANMLRELEIKFLQQFKAQPSAWIDGNTSPQELVVFTDCSNQANCAPYAVNPLAGLRRRTDFKKYKLSTSDTVFIGNGAELVFETARAAYNANTTDGIQALQTLNALPNLIMSPYFDDVFATMDSSYQILEVNPNLIGFSTFSDTLERGNAAGQSPRIFRLDELVQAIERVRLSVGLNEGASDITVPVLVPFQTGSGTENILMDLTMKKSGCSQDGYKVSMQLKLVYLLDILPASDFICGVSPLYNGFTLHNTVLPCEPKQLTPSNCTFTPPTELCLKYSLPECGLSIKKGTQVIGVTGSIIGTAQYQVATEVTDNQGLAYLLNNVFANSGIGAFYYDAATGLVKYVPSATGIAIGATIILSGVCLGDFTVDIIDCVNVPGGSTTIEGGITTDITTSLPVAFTAEPTNCTTATYGYILYDNSGTGTIDIIQNEFSSVADAFADYQARLAAAGYAIGHPLRLELWGTCVEGSKVWADYTVLADVKFDYVILGAKKGK